MKIVILEGSPNRQGSSHIPAEAFAKGAKEAGNKTVTIWWRQAPRIISTFLKRCNLNGKTIVPFRTPASSGMGPSAANLRPLSGNPAFRSAVFRQRLPLHGGKLGKRPGPFPDSGGLTIHAAPPGFGMGRFHRPCFEKGGAQNA